MHSVMRMTENCRVPVHIKLLVCKYFLYSQMKLSSVKDATGFRLQKISRVWPLINEVVNNVAGRWKGRKYFTFRFRYNYLFIVDVIVYILCFIHPLPHIKFRNWQLQVYRNSVQLFPSNSIICHKNLAKIFMLNPSKCEGIRSSKNLNFMY